MLKFTTRRPIKVHCIQSMHWDFRVLGFENFSLCRALRSFFCRVCVIRVLEFEFKSLHVEALQVSMVVLGTPI